MPSPASLPRKSLFYLHLVAGVIAGLVILLMSATGIALAFEQQIIASINRSYAAPPAPGALQLSTTELIAKARALAPSAGAAVTNITIYADPARPALVAFGRDGAVFVDTHTGTGGPARGTAFFRTTTDLHRWLALTGDFRAKGKAVTGAANLIFLLIVISGLILWLPPAWKWTVVKLRVVPAFRMNAKAREWNWHNVLGVWFFLPMILIVPGAVVISYGWASDLVYRAAGELPPGKGGGGVSAGVAAAGANQGGRRPGEVALSTQPLSQPALSLDEAVTAARGYYTPWMSLSFAPPKAPLDPIPFTLSRGTGRQPQHKATLTVYPSTGERVFETAAAQSSGRRARLFWRFAHTGEYFGLTGQAIGLLACAAACMLVYTGFALSLRRGINFVRQRKSHGRTRRDAPLDP